MKHTNELINETSPYLLQHAHNPVNWFPWSAEILKKASNENKLVIVSIGYSACHWCHVMEHESFEDDKVAEFMNTYFISIKVDREERPDIDNLYMNACHLTSGNGGWPLNAIAFPDGRPIFAGTYFPKANWLHLLSHFVKLAINEPDKLYQQANQIEEGLKMMDNIYKPINEPKEFTSNILDDIWRHWLPKIDFTWGGRAGAPKFMMPNNLIYLSKYYSISKEDRALEAINISLEKMALGGIYDQIGGGFARYSTDAFWKVPHFEKMLYDNAQLLSAYSIAYKNQNNELYLETIESIYNFLMTELKDISGGFYAALDADSEGIEGKFYIWSFADFMRITKNDKLLANYYSVTEEGNWEDGHNILFRTETDDLFCKKNNLTQGNWKENVIAQNRLLLNERNTRIRPGLDDKILLNWNALLVNGLIEAFRATKNEKYLNEAISLGKFLLNTFLNSDGSINRTFKNGKSSIAGLLIDYVTFADALFNLYQITFDEQFIKQTTQFLEYIILHFHDKKSSLFFFTADNQSTIITRGLETSDNVIPAANSILANLLFRFGKMTYNDSYIQMAKNMVSIFIEDTIKNGSFFSNWAILLADLVEEPFEICILGSEAINFNHTLQQYNLPNALFAGASQYSTLPFLEDKLGNPDETLIFICKNKACFAPTNNLEEAIKIILAQN
ncbi:MAG: thioredoxin domain-containing protein [Chitinophagales bacterium]|nr:thioredoxin domain-containing protein [Chitinophagales bacterium]